MHWRHPSSAPDREGRLFLALLFVPAELGPAPLHNYHRAGAAMPLLSSLVLPVPVKLVRQRGSSRGTEPNSPGPKIWSVRVASHPPPRRCWCELLTHCWEDERSPPSRGGPLSQASAHVRGPQLLGGFPCLVKDSLQFWSAQLRGGDFSSPCGWASVSH